jgi:hypoxanthine-guanine phosphoribosyltransferase
VHIFYSFRDKILENYRQEENKKYFEGYASLHYILYLRETLLGENTVDEGTTISDIQDLLERSDFNRVAIKTQNLIHTITQLFPNVFVACRK